MFGEGDGRPEDPNVVPARGLFSRRRDRYQRRRPVDVLLNSNEGEVDSLGSFKMTTPYFTHNQEGRPVHTCCTCFPENRKKIPQNFMTLPVRNCFNVKVVNKDNWYMPYFAHLAHFMAKKELASHYKFIEPEQVITTDLFSYIEGKNIDEENKQVSEEKSRALQFLNSFAVHPKTETEVSRRIRIGGWLAFKFFSSVFDGICVHDGQISLLKSLQKHHPVIYVPLQKSHWDHFILSMVLIDSDIPTPLLLARKSLLQVPILGSLAKWTLGLGCRPGRMDNNKNSKANINQESHRSISVAHDAYLTALLKEGMGLELSVEKHRSRTGKPGTVFVGTEFFNFILRLLKERDIEDAIIVPVTISYEKCPEENLINNYCHAPKQTGMFRQLWNVFRILVNCVLGRKNQRLGYARVDFAHPISVREFRDIVMTPSRIKDIMDRFEDDNFFWMTDGYCNPISSKQLNWDRDVGSVSSLSSVYADTETMVPKNNDAILLADTITSHTIYDALRASSIMSTHFLAFLLLTRYRQGATMETLVSDLNDLILCFRERKNDVGFYKQSDLTCVIYRAAHLLGPTLIKISTQSDKSVFVKPNLDRSSLVQLGYYSNHIISFLTMEGIIATALFSLRGPKLKLYNGTSVEVYVNENELVQIAAQLVRLLKAEFLLHPPCEQLEDVVKATIVRMRDEYLLVTEMLAARHDYDDDDGGGDYVDNHNDQKIIIKALQDTVAFRKLCQVRNIIIPYVQVYVEAFLVLYDLLPSPEDKNVDNSGMPELTLREIMLERVLQVSSIQQEVAVMDTIINFLEAMKQCGVIEEKLDGESGKITCCLHESFAAEEMLDIARNNMLSLLSF